MCLIIDANLAARVFSDTAEADFTPILDWVEKQGGCLVIGGQLSTELDRIEKARRLVIQWLRAGRARRISTEAVELEQAAVQRKGLCQSNDHHVIALALASGARTLCTHDQALQRDFKNAELIARPRGAIYKRQAHSRLLRHTSSCGRLTRKR